MLTLSAIGILALLFSLLLTPVCGTLFRRWRVIDYPDGDRKLHKQPVPRSGGLSIAISYACALAVVMALRPEHNPLLLAHSSFLLKMLFALAVIVITGLLDDLRGLSVRQKLTGQILAGSLAYLAGVRMLAISGTAVETLWSAPLTVLWLVACSNAFNLMDGVDGLAGGLALCSTAALFTGAVIDHNLGLALTTLPLAGALLGFLRYNFTPASVFLGDSGSLGIGFIVGCCAIIWTSESSSLLSVSAAGMAVAVPLLDSGLSIVRRFLSRKPIFRGDRGHVHHKLIDIGFGPRAVTLLLCGAAVIGSAFAMAEHMLSGVYGVIILMSFLTAAGVSISFLRYEEFATVARLVFGHKLRTVVQSEILLHSFKRAIDRAANLDECWLTVQAWRHDLGFDEARLCNSADDDQGRKGLVLPDGWLLAVPLADGMRIDLIRHGSSRMGLEGQVAEILHSRANHLRAPRGAAAVSTNGNAKTRPLPAGPVVIIGAGPAGLTAAYELSRYHVPSIVLEKGSIVGGLARTEQYKGYLFDIGGHRFFTKVSIVEQMWREVLGNDFIKRPRLSRIYYKSRFFSYPLEPMNALRNLGIFESILCVLSYVKAQLLPDPKEDNFETWISNRFGRRLFNNFFKTYTEKVWGIPCREIGAEWAAQRIRGLSLASLIRSALLPKGAQSKGKAIKTLIEEFDYPRRGPGMMWVKTQELIESRGSRVVLQAGVEKIRWEPGRVLSVEAGGHSYSGQYFINSMSLKELIRCFDPPAPPDVRRAAEAFQYRDFLTVVLIVRGANLFPDNWIYVHEPGIKVGRIQNYNNWSPEMVPDPGFTCLGLEYFCSVNDNIWKKTDQELFELGKKEIVVLGLVDQNLIEDGTVMRVEKAYPVYDEHYKASLATLRAFLDPLTNFQTTGRNGMHRYNNQDHSMLTAILAVRNLLGGRYDLWNVNVDAEYHEEGAAISEQEIAAMESSQPMVPRARQQVSAGTAVSG